MNKRIIDISNQKFGRLTAIKFAYIKNHQSIWECKCDCGNVKLVSGSNLRSNHTKSCGCIREERLRKLGKDRRKIEGESSFNALFYAYKVNSKKRDLKFLLTKEEFRRLTKQKCHYCGSPPNQIRDNKNGSYGIYIYNGVDRINNNEGYTLNNCVACCKDCNIAKGTKSLKEFVRWIERVYVYTVKDNYP